MRLDKFLKVSRLVKLRTLAKQVCDAQRVSINGRAAKPGSEVSVGDTLEIDFGSHVLNVTVVAVRESANTAEARSMYRVTRDEIKKEW